MPSTIPSPARLLAPTDADVSELENPAFDLLLGRRSGEVFPDEFGHQYEAQDERVASDGETV